MNTQNCMNPWGILDELFGTDSRVFKSARARAAGRFPPVNVYLDDNAIIIDLELPGKTAKDVELTLEQQAVVVADKPDVVVDKNGAPETRESAWRRRLELPFRVNADKAAAKFTNGVLRIELPRAEAAGAHRIAIAD